MKKAPTKQNQLFRIANRKHLLPLVAAGGGLAAAPANAIELGDVMVQSRLGQPLSASIAYALAPNEQISGSCVFLGRSASGLPGIGRATLSVSDGRILLSGETPLREPMVATRVVVDCPYTANLSRDYMMFIDPAGPAYEAAAAPEAPAEAAPTPVAPVARVTPVANREPIGKSTRYQVQRGDSLSVIAQRIENRPVGLWPAVNAIFEANPDAFMDNDPNKLKAGSWLEIPSFDGSEPVIASSTPSTSLTEAAQPASAYAGIEEETVQPAVNEPAAVESAPVIEPEAPAASTVEVVEQSADTTSDLRPGDIILDDGTVSAGDSIVIPDVELDGPETASSSPNVPTAVINTSSATEQPQSPWLLWLAGGGAAIVVALLLFGNRLRRSPAPLGAASLPGEAAADETESIEAYTDDEYDIDDDSPTAENLALDADLVVGTGLEEGTEMEVSEIFDIPSPTEVDIELPFEPEATAVTMETDIIPPVNTDEHSILESEILPDDDDYDMSVIVDATKMPRPEDVTERDLQAIEVDPVDDEATTDSYTINREADFNILERDYEDELTATQALNKEIARAAAEFETDASADEDNTSEMPLATVTELDVTAQLPRRGGEATDPDDTLESEAPTVNTAGEDRTEEMPAAGNEDTVEMDVESGKVGTRDA